MDDRAVIESFEKSWGQRLGILAIALVIVGVLVGLVFMGFHGRRIEQGAEALTPAKVPTQPLR